ncbi:CoA-transferase subunit beta [Thermoanaerobacterium sp. DL9XJH110]|uniref:CoA-transferase subunit beta n=1 Tax=Thermoanaerobacterium sp. DL9XJH110 TaxID=3386643 RepID=UPI003BB73BB6
MVKEYTTNELMAVTASRLLRDGDNVVVGLGLPQIASLLAKSTHAPNLNIIYEIGVINPDAVEMGVGIADPRLWYNCEHFTSFVGSLGQVLQKGMVDVGFLGGLQVDKYGNINSTLVKTDSGSRHINGSGGASDIACFAKRLLIIMKHDKRKLVEKVDYITSVGYLEGFDSRSQHGVPMCEYIKIITNLCVFSFNEERVLKIETLHPGVSVQEVIENTGVKVFLPDGMARTSEPSDEEIYLLRNRIDPLKMYI